MDVTKCLCLKKPPPPHPNDLFFQGCTSVRRIRMKRNGFVFYDHPSDRAQGNEPVLDVYARYSEAVSSCRVCKDQRRTSVSSECSGPTDGCDKPLQSVNDCRVWTHVDSALCCTCNCLHWLCRSFCISTLTPCWKHSLGVKGDTMHRMRALVSQLSLCIPS